MEQIPIVVGGTSYWIQHLIFPDRLAYNGHVATFPASADLANDLAKSIASLPPDLLDVLNNLPEHPPLAAANPDAALALHKLLNILDPSVAARWHWRDTRKVLRSLCIFKETGRRPSEIIQDQSKNTSKPR